MQLWQAARAKFLTGDTAQKKLTRKTNRDRKRDCFKKKKKVTWKNSERQQKVNEM